MHQKTIPAEEGKAMIRDKAWVQISHEGIWWNQVTGAIGYPFATNEGEKLWRILEVSPMPLTDYPVY